MDERMKRHCTAVRYASLLLLLCTLPALAQIKGPTSLDTVTVNPLIVRLSLGIGGGDTTNPYNDPFLRAATADSLWRLAQQQDDYEGMQQTVALLCMSALDPEVARKAQLHFASRAWVRGDTVKAAKAYFSIGGAAINAPMHRDTVLKYQQLGVHWLARTNDTTGYMSLHGRLLRTLKARNDLYALDRSARAYLADPRVCMRPQYAIQACNHLRHVFQRLGDTDSVQKYVQQMRTLYDGMPAASRIRYEAFDLMMDAYLAQGTALQEAITLARQRLARDIPAHRQWWWNTRQFDTTIVFTLYDIRNRDPWAEMNTCYYLGRFYTLEDNPDSALYYYRSGLSLRDLAPYAPKLLPRLGQVEVQLGLTGSARVHLDEAIALADTMGQSEDLAIAHLYLFRLDSAAGQWQRAALHARKHQLYADRLRNEQRQEELRTQLFKQRLQAEADKAAAEQRMVQAEAQRQRLLRNIGFGVSAVVLLLLLLVARQRARIAREKQRSDDLLLNILPAEVAEELKENGRSAARAFDGATILFSDFKGFTQASEKMSPQELVAELGTCFEAFDHITTARGIEKIKTIGDAYMCVGGLPDPKTSTPADVVHAALEMQAFMQQRKAERDAKGLPAFDMRVGIHTGPVVAGIVGVKKFQYDIWGDTVNTASRMESSGDVGQVNISESTYEIVKSEHGLSFTPRGKVQAKGKGEMEMYFVDARP